MMRYGPPAGDGSLQLGDNGGQRSLYRACSNPRGWNAGDRPIERQAEVTLNNLRTAVEAAGGTLEDITQVIVYLTRLEDKPAFDDVYAAFFGHRYPNRACIVISALALPNTHLEIIAYAHIDS